MIRSDSRIGDHNSRRLSSIRMRSFAILLLSFAFLLPIAFGQRWSKAKTDRSDQQCGRQAPAYSPNLPTRKSGHRIINGKEAKPHSWPWMVFISVDMGANRINLCGGSLLRVNDQASDILLTAAHCVTRGETQATKPQIYDLSRIKILAGAHRRKIYEYGQRTRNVAKVIHYDGFLSIHNWTTSTFHDIALIKLKDPIYYTDTIRPICVAPKASSIPTGRTCIATGWGRNDSTAMEGYPDALQQLVMPVQSVSTCKQSWGTRYIEDQMMCAGSMDGTSATCNGDSGSQLACQEPDGQWLLHGVFSWMTANRCALAGKPPVFVRASQYESWINEQIKALSSVSRKV